MKKTVAIILNGEGLEAERLQQALQGVAVLIAADGGANYCRQHNVPPHYIIGDLDSIKKASRNRFEQSELIYLADQYSTDLEKALILAESKKPDRLRILNATGKRSDHALANLLFLAQASRRMEVEVIDNFGRLTFLQAGEHRIDLARGQTISFLSVSAVRNLTLSGFQYPLTAQTFDDFFVGISNVVAESPCTVAFDEGTLIMYEVQRFE